MAQHDYIISNQSGAAFRSDLNNALAAIVSQNSGASAPSTTYAYQFWADTTTGLLKIRNAANSAWIALRELDGTLTIEDGSASTPGLAFESDLNTGLYRVGADQLGFATGGTGRLLLDASGNLVIGDVSDTNTYIGHPAADTLAITTGGTERVRFNSGGNTGFGVASPDYRIDLACGDTTAGLGYGMRVRANSTAAAGSIQFTDSAVSAEWAVITGLSAGLKISSALMVGLNTTTYPTAANGQISAKTDSATAYSHFVLANGTQGYFYINVADNYSWNGAAQVMGIGKIASNNRSINAAGTVNASGADYAEYMTKAGSFDLAKGEICGITSDGKLTNVFSKAISFVVKSTNPSYVGGDTWGTEDIVGVKPDASDAEAFAEWEAKLEEERQKVDRIAFAGQVPVNVIGATPGQYIVPVEAADGCIEGIAKSEADLTLAEYMRAVGKVIASEDDGRARIIVKVA